MPDRENALGYRCSDPIRSENLKLNGRLSLGDPVDRVGETLKDLLDAGHNYFLVDLQEVPAIDSSGIGLLVRYLTAAKQRGGSLKLLNPSKFAVQTLNWFES